MPHAPRIGSGGKGDGRHRAVHFRISEVEASQLEAYAERLAAERKAKVSVSEAVRDLMAKGLQQDRKPWEAALQSLPFVAWQGGKPELHRPEGVSGEKPLSAIILEDREERL